MSRDNRLFNARAEIRRAMDLHEGNAEREKHSEIERDRTSADKPNLPTRQVDPGRIRARRADRDRFDMRLCLPCLITMSIAASTLAGVTLPASLLNILTGLAALSLGEWLFAAIAAIALVEGLKSLLGTTTHLRHWPGRSNRFEVGNDEGEWSSWKAPLSHQTVSELVPSDRPIAGAIDRGELVSVKDKTGRLVGRPKAIPHHKPAIDLVPLHRANQGKCLAKEDVR